MPMKHQAMKTISRRSTVVALSILCAFPVFGAKKKSKRDEWQQPDRVMRDLNIQAGSSFADVGCGKGFFTFKILDVVGKDGKVIAVDIDEKSLEKLKKTAADKGMTNIEVIQSEPADTKLVPESVDNALICLVLHHCDVECRQPIVNGAANALTPGGFLYIMDFKKVHNPPHHTYEELVAREAVIAFAEKAGLKLDAEWFYLEHQYFLRFHKPLK